MRLHIQYLGITIHRDRVKQTSQSVFMCGWLACIRKTNNIKSFTQSILGWKLIGHIVRKQSCGGKQLPPLSVNPLCLILPVHWLFSHTLPQPVKPAPLHSPSSNHFISLSVSLRESKSMHSAFHLHNLHIGLVFQSQVTSQMELSPKSLRPLCSGALKLQGLSNQLEEATLDFPHPFGFTRDFAEMRKSRMT